MSDSAMSADQQEMDGTTAEGLSPEATELVNTLLTAALALALVTCVHAILICTWRHCVNRRYWKRVAPMPLPPGVQPPKPPAFRPFPAALIFPAPLVLTSCLFLTGIVKHAVRVLVSAAVIDWPVFVAVAALSLVALFMSALAIDLALFWRRHARGVSASGDLHWQPRTAPSTPEGIDDPWMRRLALGRVYVHGTRLYMGGETTLAEAAPPQPSIRVTRRFDHYEGTWGPWGCEQTTVSTPRMTFGEARGAALNRLRAGGHADRTLGVFAGKAEDDAAEPARTERLLASPFALRHARTGDALQAREGFLLFRVNGATRIGFAWRLMGVLVNITLALLAAIAPILEAGSLPAYWQSLAVLALQILMALIGFCCLPDSDRLVSHLLGLQYLLEAVATALLITADLASVVSHGDIASTARVSALMNAGLWAALLAMTLPMIQLLEQRCITPAVVRRRRGRATWLGGMAHFVLTHLTVTLPRRVDGLIRSAARIDVGGKAGSDGTGPDSSALPARPPKVHGGVRRNSVVFAADGDKLGTRAARVVVGRQSAAAETAANNETTNDMVMDEDVEMITL